MLYDFFAIMLFHQHTFLFASVLSLALQAIAINPGDLRTS